MNNDLLSKIDSNYLLLENITNREKAKEVFESFIQGIKSINIKDRDLEKIFEGTSKIDILSEIAKYSLICSCQDNEELRKEPFVEFKNRLLSENIDCDNVIDYLYDDKELLKRIIGTFIDTRYHNQNKINYNINDKKVKKYIFSLEQKRESQIKHSAIGKIKNLMFNKSRKDVINDLQFKINSREYSLGKDLYAFIDRGKESLSQEDSVLLLKHPDNEDFKMIAVADGESAKMCGDEASNYAVYSLLKWFESLDPSYYSRMEELKKLLEEELKKINFELMNNPIDKATTIAVSIIGKPQILISTIGNSRILLIKDNKIVEETKDDSYVQSLCDNGLIDPKMSRFHKTADILMNELGIIKDKEVIMNNTKIRHNRYDKILVLTDGVTKIVDNDKIEKILNSNEDERITSELVKTAKTEDVLTDVIDPYCTNKIEANNKNMTAAMYIKRR